MARNVVDTIILVQELWQKPQLKDKEWGRNHSSRTRNGVETTVLGQGYGRNQSSRTRNVVETTILGQEMQQKPQIYEREYVRNNYFRTKNVVENTILELKYCGRNHNSSTKNVKIKFDIQKLRENT